MPNINAGNGVVTHVNVFTVPPDKQQALVDSLARGGHLRRNTPLGAVQPASERRAT